MSDHNADIRFVMLNGTWAPMLSPAYIAYCSCGWEADPRHVPADAWEDKKYHLEDVGDLPPTI